jgi:NDP-sugar pyrophosphorylase family protein
MNGDDYTDVDLRAFAVAHQNESSADVSLVVVRWMRGDAVSILLDADWNVVQFAEKESPLLAHHLNAGIYMLSREMLYRIPAGQLMCTVAAKQCAPQGVSA